MAPLDAACGGLGVDHRRLRDEGGAGCCCSTMQRMAPPCPLAKLQLLPCARNAQLDTTVDVVLSGVHRTGLADIFERLEAKRAALSIADYSLAQPTLEQVPHLPGMH